MKRTAVFLLAVLLLLGGCRKPQQSSPDSFRFYYPAAEITYREEGAFCSVSAEPDTEDAEAVVRAYLDASVPENASPVIPAEWSFLSAEQDKATIILSFGGKPTDSLSRSLTFACLAKTILQLPEIQRISISCPDTEEPTILTANDYFLTDTGMLPQEETVVLYYPDSAGRYLLRQTVSVDADSAADKPRCIVQQLLSAKENGLPASCIPEGTELLGIEVENGICTVNLSAPFSENMEKSFSSERMAVYSIVNSLTELPEITSVDFLLHGAPMETLYLMDLSSGVVRDESILASASEKGVADVTLYPLCDSEGRLVPIPKTLVLSEEENLADTVIHALLEYEIRNGMQGCIPAQTKLLSVRMENGSCILDLTAEFTEGCANEAEEQAAVRSVIATVCALPNVSKAEILVEGIEPVFRNAALSGAHQPEQSWFTE